MHSFNGSDRKPVALSAAGVALIKGTLAETRVGGDNVEIANQVDVLFAELQPGTHDLSHDEIGFVRAILRKQLFGPDQRADAAALLAELRAVHDSFYKPE